MAKQVREHFYVAVKRNYEDVWRVVITTRQEAEDHMAERRSWTGAFNYDNAELRVLSTGEAKAEFGATWVGGIWRDLGLQAHWVQGCRRRGQAQSQSPRQTTLR